MVVKNEEDYEYDLPSPPFQESDESLGQRFFTHPSQIPEGIEPFDPERDIKPRSLTPWIMGCVFMIILGGFFEFGILGKDGKKGPLCPIVFSGKICTILAGTPTSVKK